MSLRDLNERGDLVGAFANRGAESSAFLYTHERGLVDLNSLLPDDSPWQLATANAINNARTIVGTGRLRGEPVNRPYRLHIADDGSVTVGPIGDFAPEDVAAPWGINDFGEICGQCHPAAGETYVWYSSDGTAAVPLEMPVRGLTNAPVGINQQGQIIGSLMTDVGHVYRVAPGRLAELLPTTSPHLSVHDLNDAGEFVGEIDWRGRHATYRCNGDSFLEIAKHADSVQGINNQGDVVGYWRSSDHFYGGQAPPVRGHRAFVYLERVQTVVDLDDVVTGAPDALGQWFTRGTRPQPCRINDAGVIAGLLGDSASRTRIFILTPHGEPEKQRVAPRAAAVGRQGRRHGMRGGRRETRIGVVRDLQISG